MKKVLVISGGPRPSGNTYKVARLVEEQVKYLGEVNFEYVFLKEITLKYCQR